MAQDSQTLSAQRRASCCERRNPVRARRQGTGTLIRNKISKSNFKLQNCFKNTKMRETNTLWTCTVLPKFQQKVTDQDFVHLNTMSPLEGQTERRWTVDLVGTIKQTNKQTKTWTNQTCKEREEQHFRHFRAGLYKGAGYNVVHLYCCRRTAAPPHLEPTWHGLRKG